MAPLRPDWLPWLLLLCILTIPMPSMATEQETASTAAMETQQATAALNEQDLAGALHHFLKAAEQNPDNPNYCHSVAVLSKKLGKSDQALEYFLKAIPLAAKAGNRADLALYHQEVASLRNIDPVWVGAQRAKATYFPPGKNQAVGTWSRLQQEAEQAMAKGENDQGIERSLQALRTAKDHFGDEHYATMASLRALALRQYQSGKVDEALASLQQAAAVGEKILSLYHPDLLAIHGLRADMLQAQARIAEEVTIRQQIYDRYKDKAGLGSNHPKTLQAGLELGRAQLNLSQESLAQPLVANLCQQIQTLDGPYAEERADCLTLLATIQERQGHVETGQATLEQVEHIQSLTLEENALPLLATRVERAELSRRLGDLTKARHLLDGVLASGKDPNTPVMIAAKERASRVMEDQGQYDQAETLIREVIAFEETHQVANHPNLLAAQDKLAGLLRHQGKLAEAEHLYRAVLAGYRHTLGDDNQATLNVMNNLGLTLENMGLYDEAEPLLRLTVEVSRKKLGDHHATTLAFMNNLAMLYESQGVFDKADPLYLQAIHHAEESLGRDHDHVLAFVNNLAYLALLQQDYDKASPLFERVLTTWTNQLGEAHQKTLKAMNNLARVRHHQGQYAEAERLFLKTLALRRQVLGNQHMDVLRSLHDLGALYRDMQRYDEAEERLQEALREDDKVLGEQHPYTFEALNTLADLLEDKKASEEAYRLRKKGFERRTTFLNRMLWATGDNAREGYIQLHRPELMKYLALLSNRQDTADSGRQALEVGWQRKGLLLKITSEIRQITTMAQDPELDRLSRDLTTTRKELAALTLSGPTEEGQDNHLERLHGLENQVDMLQLKLGDASKRFRRSIHKTTTEELASHLPDQAGLIDYLIYNDGKKDRLMAAVLTKEGGLPHYHLITLPPPLSQIQTAIQAYRAIIQDEDAETEEILELGMKTYDMVWHPLEKVLGNRSELYLVPDGLLNILPFHALVNRQGEYLAKSLDLHILSSSRDLLPLDNPTATGGFLILAGPDYNTEEGMDASSLTQIAGKRAASVSQGMRSLSGLRGLKFDPLPGAEKEGKIIMGQVKQRPENRMYLQTAAQERVVQSLTVPPEVLHIATHGFFLKPDASLRQRLLKLARSSALQVPPPGDNPLLRAGLAFAGINRNAPFLGEIDTHNDGVLTALEVLALDLSGTRLAVLSACETGLGEIHEGEGVYGLRRSFQEAGVESVISSLWEVSDAGTQALMIGLYRHLNEGKSPHVAMREARHEMMDSTEWNYPYVWSAFMLVGK